MILFSEKQRFTQWWLWLILVVALLDPFYLLLKNPSDYGKNPWAIFFSLIVPILIILFFKLICLEMRIERDHIQFRFFPFHRKFRNISKGELAKAYVRKYRPLSDYGGWGIRWSLSGKGRAYNISGNEGLQIVCKDGRKLLIGTRRPQQVAQVLLQAGFPADNSF